MTRFEQPINNVKSGHKGGMPMWLLWFQPTENTPKSQEHGWVFPECESSGRCRVFDVRGKLTIISDKIDGASIKYNEIGGTDWKSWFGFVFSTFESSPSASGTLSFSSHFSNSWRIRTVYGHAPKPNIAVHRCSMW